MVHQTLKFTSICNIAPLLAQIASGRKMMPCIGGRGVSILIVQSNIDSVLIVLHYMQYRSGATVIMLRIIDAIKLLFTKANSKIYVRSYSQILDCGNS